MGSVASAMLASAAATATDVFASAAATSVLAATKTLLKKSWQNKLVSALCLLMVTVAVLSLELSSCGHKVAVLVSKPEAPLLVLMRADVKLLNTTSVGTDFTVLVTMTPLLRTGGMVYTIDDVATTMRYSSQAQTFKDIGRTLTQLEETMKIWQADFFFHDFSPRNATNGSPLRFDFELTASVEWRAQSAPLTGKMPFRASCPIELPLQGELNSTVAPFFLDSKVCFT